MLELLMADADAERLRALEDFAGHRDIQCLAGLLEDARTLTAVFNLFEELGLWWQEDIHSRILSWLLGPKKSHGLGDRFLKEFLRCTGLISDADACSDWSVTTSQPEWGFVVGDESGRVDILLVNERAGFVCAIENKIFSTEGGRQLTRYRKALEAEFSNYNRFFVFLSPEGRESRWEEEREFWKPVSYSTVLHVVEQFTDYASVVMSADVRLFLRQYSATLRRRIVPEVNEVAKQARRIYLEHREIIEFVYRHKPDYQAEINRILRDAIRQQPNWLLDDCDKRYVRFCSDSWEEFDCFRSGDGWPSRALILFEFHCKEDNANFRLVLAPSKAPVRSVLFDRAKVHAGLFNLARAGAPAEGYHHVYRSNNILSESDLSDWYDIRSRGPNRLRQFVADFAENEFPAMNKVIYAALRDYQPQPIAPG